MSPAERTCEEPAVLSGPDQRDNRDDGVASATAKLLLRPEEAAEVLGIGRSKLYELLVAGDVESVHIGKCRRVPRAALEEYVQRLRWKKNIAQTQEIA